jgi:arginyl-tRNA synthetase
LNFENLDFDIVSNFDIRISSLNTEELSLLRTFAKFPEVVAAAAENYAPNVLCNYLYDLSGKFNLFYSRYRIINSKLDTSDGGRLERSGSHDSSGADQTEQFRLALTFATGQILKTGLNLLGIQALGRM